jgi:TolB protein
MLLNRSFAVPCVALIVALAACDEPTSSGRVAAGDGFVFGALDGNGGVEIFLMNADGTNRRQLTQTQGNSFSPAWSPDGRRIAFASTREAMLPQIFIMNANGSGARRVTDPADGHAEGGVSWSPDGSRLVFACRPPATPREELCVIDSDGADRRRLLPDGWRGLQPAWSPDGQAIAFAGGAPGQPGFLNLWTVSPSGGEPRLLGVNSSGEEPAWSPDGAWLAFRATRPPPPPFAAGLPEVFIMRADGTERRPLISDMSPLESSYAATWSPDGQRLAFVRYGETGTLYVANADGSDDRIVSLSVSGVSGLSWTARSP